ncbi:MAG: glycosyltransferase [Elusimicrobia bacterium]|nr:glycosyltransferase [Elusimicrobiota bacterium]
MKIAILGSRGIPCRMGGFERYAEEIGARLAKMGHQVTVYCENGNSPAPRPAELRGMRLVHLPHLSGKLGEALSFDLLSCAHSAFQDYDVVYMLGFGWGYFCLLPRLAGKTVVVNMDGMEWQRGKWNWLGKAVLLAARNASLQIAQHLVCDSRAMLDYYRDNFRGDFHYLSYGADVRDVPLSPRWRTLGFEPRRYATVVCRFEPENNLDLVLDEYLASSCPLPLAVVGGSTYPGNPLTRRLAETRDPRIVAVGVVSDQAQLAGLRANALLHVHGHEVGGTNPSLLDAMGLGNVVAAMDVPYNREVLGEAGLFFTKEPGDLRRTIDSVWRDPGAFDSLREAARDRIRAHYDWDLAARRHDEFFRSLAPRASNGRRPRREPRAPMRQS